MNVNVGAVDYQESLSLDIHSLSGMMARRNFLNKGSSWSIGLVHVRTLAFDISPETHSVNDRHGLGQG